MFLKRNIGFLAIASCLTLATGAAMATGEPYETPYTYKYQSSDAANGGYSAGRPIVASKAYVDSNDDKLKYEITQKQSQLGGTGLNDKVVTSSATLGSVTYTNKATAGTDITSITAQSTAAAKGALTTAEAVKAALDAQATTNGNTYQPKVSGNNYNIGTNGTWKPISNGTYVQPAADGNNVKFDIPSTQITSGTSDVASAGTKLVTSGVLYDYAVAKAQGTQYKVLTTNGTNGTVQAEYLSVPVTGGGQPGTSGVTTSGVAAMWLE